MVWATAEVMASSITEAQQLVDWLGGNPTLRGKVTVPTVPVAEGYQGSTSDIVAVALGSGGAVAVLINILPTWLKLRRNSGKIRVRFRNKDGEEFDTELEHMQDRDAILKDILQFLGDRIDGE